MERIIIGLTGAFGCGTSFLAANFFENNGFKKFSLSQVLKDKFEAEKGRKPKDRHDLQEFGNEVREKNEAFLAEEINKKIQELPENCNVVIESFRNPAEIKFFRNLYTEFVLIGVFADYDVRWKRVESSYNGSKDTFDQDEQMDKGTFEPKYGQKISDCFFEADLIISNNEDISCEDPNEVYYQMDSKIKGYLKAFKDPTNSNPTLTETLMAAAYTSGRRSKCIKRKVGAIIADKYDRIISSGFNGVPYGLKECKSSLGKCYRDIKREEIAKKVSKDLNLIEDNSAIKTIKGKVKLLELCRSLHGEESAIMNLVGKGIDLTDSSIYVTTYPCNLCANKIVQANIKKVVYFEPYPVEEAKKIFKEANVQTVPFEGVTFRAFFKFYQYEP